MTSLKAMLEGVCRTYDSDNDYKFDLFKLKIKTIRRNLTNKKIMTLTTSTLFIFGVIFHVFCTKIGIFGARVLDLRL